jgi:Carboxypeptidase regulatory-like domain
MKPLIALLVTLTCCDFASSECVEVTGAEAKPSSRNARITVVLDGKPQGNVKLSVTLPGGQRSRSFVTDSQGTVALKDLPVGTSCITADGENYLRADLCLAVSKQTKNKISSFTLALVDMLPPAPALGNVLVAEKNAAPERLRQLDGVVLDQTDAVIAHAEIQVYKHGSYAQNPIAKVWSDQEGRFTVPLNPDNYIITVRMPGFRSAVRVVEISPDGREGQLRETLEIGKC